MTSDGIDTPELASWLGTRDGPRQAPGGRQNARATQETQDAVIREKMALALPCIVCGGPEAVRVVFCPKDQAAVAAPPGQTRMARYSLCDRCARRPDSAGRAERRIFAGMAGAARVN